MIWPLLLVGGWIIFDGVVSGTLYAYFIDHTWKNWPDQLTRVVRALAGIVALYYGWTYTL